MNLSLPEGATAQPLPTAIGHVLVDVRVEHLAPMPLPSDIARLVAERS